MAKKNSGGSGFSGNSGRTSKAKGRQRTTSDWRADMRAAGTPF